MKQKFYAVRRGRQIGIFSTWPECQRQVINYPGAEYKSFPTREEAVQYVSGNFQAPSSSFVTMTSEESIVDIWVDGSCIPQPDSSLRLGWAYLAQRDDKEIRRDRGNDIPFEARQHRNVAGEIMAVLKAIEWCKLENITHVRIYYDYQGLASWPTKAWKTNTDYTKHYAETVQESGISIEWVKVKAHSGDPNNEIVDKEAKQAALQHEKEE